MKKISLRKLACDLAKMDGASGRNQDVVGAETALASLGRYLRMLSLADGLAVIAAISERSGGGTKAK